MWLAHHRQFVSLKNALLPLWFLCHALKQMSVKLATSPAIFPATRTDFSQNRIENQLNHEDHENRTHLFIYLKSHTQVKPNNGGPHSHEHTHPHTYMY